MEIDTDIPIGAGAHIDNAADEQITYLPLVDHEGSFLPIHFITGTEVGLNIKARDKKGNFGDNYPLLEQYQYEYSRLSLSRPRLSRITAYLEEKIWSLFKYRNLTSGNKIMWIRGEIAPQEQFFPFPQYFQYIFLTKGV